MIDEHNSDNARIWTLEREMAVMQGRLVTVEGGVSNFRAFQQDMRDYVVEQRTLAVEREKQDKQRARVHFALLGGLISLIVGLSIWFVTWVVTGKHALADTTPPTVSLSSPQDATAHFTR